MYSDAISNPGEGVPLPCSASDARNETSAFRSLAVRRLVRIGKIAEPDCAAAMAARNVADAANADFFIGDLPCGFGVDFSAAIAGSAGTLDAIRVLGEIVIDGQFLARLDDPLGVH